MRFLAFSLVVLYFAGCGVAMRLGGIIGASIFFVGGFLTLFLCGFVFTAVRSEVDEPLKLTLAWSDANIGTGALSSICLI